MPKKRPSVEILLATYDGERFLPALLDSVLAQQVDVPFTITVRDDASKDATPDILADYAARFPGRFRILPDGGTRLGTCANFAELINAAEADYVFFCDQDDVWLNHKMRTSLAAMRGLGDRHGVDTPLLAHTDLQVVAADLALLGRSYYAYTGVDPHRNSLADLLLSNAVTGCTIVANRALYAAARPIPHNVVMYDHWLAQVGSAIGRIAYVAESTVLYRQHGANTIGADKASARRFLRNIWRTMFTPAIENILRSYSSHAQELLERYGPRLDEHRRRQLSTLAHIWCLPRHKRVVRMMRSGLRKQTRTRSLGMMVLLLRGKRCSKIRDCH